MLIRPASCMYAAMRAVSWVSRSVSSRSAAGRCAAGSTDVWRTAWMAPGRSVRTVGFSRTATDGPSAAGPGLMRRAGPGARMADAAVRESVTLAGTVTITVTAGAGRSLAGPSEVGPGDDGGSMAAGRWDPRAEWSGPRSRVRPACTSVPGGRTPYPPQSALPVFEEVCL
jgi:hypothetical protein